MRENYLSIGSLDSALGESLPIKIQCLWVHSSPISKAWVYPIKTFALWVFSIHFYNHTFLSSVRMCDAAHDGL